MPNLFREEAVAKRTTSLFGDVVVNSGRTNAILAVVALFLASILVALLTLGTHARKERAPGFLVPSTGLARVFSPRIGLISDLSVSEDQLVEAGDPLFTVTSPRDTASGLNVNQAQIERWREDEAAIRSQLRREMALTSEREVEARHQLDEYRHQRRSLNEQRNTASDRIDLLQDEVDRLQSLNETGHAAASLVDAGRIELLDAQQEMHMVTREMDRIGGEISRVESNLRQLPLELDIRMSELRTRLRNVQSNLAEAEARQAIVVRAPIAGRIAALTGHMGGAVTPERPLLSIIPRGSEIQAELLVPTRAAGFVQEGQEVLLRYDAFPYQKFGLHRGTVKSISRTVMNPEEQIGPIRLQVPVYRVIAELDAQTVTAYGDEIPLQSGLTLQADVIRDRRRIIEWIFDPVVSATKGI